MWSPLTRRYSFAGFCRDLRNGSTFLTVHRPTVCCGVIWLWGSQCAVCGSSVSLILLAWPSVYGHYESISSCLSHLSHVSGYHGSHWANPLKAFHTRVIISSAAVAVPGAELEESETRWEQLCHLLVFNFCVPRGGIALLTAQYFYTRRMPSAASLMGRTGAAGRFKASLKGCKARQPGCFYFALDCTLSLSSVSSHKPEVCFNFSL